MTTPNHQPTPPQPVDIARLRELLADLSKIETARAALEDVNTVKVAAIGLPDLASKISKSRVAIDKAIKALAALRNDAPALLDEIASLRKDFAIARSLKWYSLCVEIAASLNCERTTEIHDAVTKLVSERDKLREDVAGLNEALKIANASADDQMFQKREAESERDSLRRENAELKAKLESK